MIWPPSSHFGGRAPSTRRTLAVCVPSAGDEKAHPICDVGDGVAVGIRSELVQRIGANGSRVVDPAVHDGRRRTFMIRIDLSASLA